MNKLINISLTIGILFFIGMEIIKNLSSGTKTKIIATLKKDFLKLPLSTQMAIVSFGIGTLLLLLHFIFKKSDIIIFTGIYYVLISFLVNGLILLKLIIDWITEVENRPNIERQALILFANIPISFVYFLIVIYTF